MIERLRCALRGHQVDDVVLTTTDGHAFGSCLCGHRTVHLPPTVRIVTVGRARIVNPEAR